jgi:hypothetical protein
MINVFEVDIENILKEAPDAKVVKIYLESETEMTCKGITIHDDKDQIVKLNPPPETKN